MKKTPLIVHIIHRLDVGGLENGLVNLINNMPTEQYRHAIVCMTKSTSFSRRINKDVPIFQLNKKEGQDFSIYPKMIRIFKEIKPDIVHSKNFGTIEAQLAAFLAGVPYRVHSEHGRDIRDIDGNNIKRIIVRRFLFLFTHTCIPLSKDLEVWLRDTLKVPERKIVQLYNGVDVGEFNESKSKPKLNDAPSGWQKRIIIGTVGRLQIIKDQKTLLSAFFHLLSQNNEFKKQLGLVVVGSGAERIKLEKMVAENQAEDYVWFAGERDNVKEFFNYLDIFVLPSLNEGISNTILEAMASSLPIIATRVGGNSELVEENKTGKLVPSNNPEEMAKALSCYLNNMDQAREHGQAGRLRVETLFSMNKMIENYTKVYDSLIR